MRKDKFEAVKEDIKVYTAKLVGIVLRGLPQFGPPILAATGFAWAMFGYPIWLLLMDAKLP